MMIRKVLLLFFSVLQFLNVLSQHSQDYKSAVAAYFKCSPFEKNADSLASELLNDSDLVVDTIIYPTDTSLFYIRGYYKTFNPFSQNVKMVELLFYETNVKNKEPTRQNRVLNYQVLGILTKDSGRNQAIEEEKKIFLNLKDLFYTWEYKKSGKGKNNSAMHWYRLRFSIPVYSGWGIWYRSQTNFCVSVMVNFTSLEGVRGSME